MNWPEWFQGFRPHQEQAIAECVEAFKHGAKVVFLDAPTGAGKTVIAEAVRRELFTKSVYICSGKTLQDQFATDFPYAKVLKGRSNYSTVKTPSVTTDECTKVKGADGKYGNESCAWCPSIQTCPYEVAKKEALSSELAVLNTTYFLTEANYIGRFSKQDFIIMDECDLIESELMRNVEFAMYSGMFKMLGLEAPKKGVHKTTIAKWLETDLRFAIQKKLREVSYQTDTKNTKRRRTLEQLLQKSHWMQTQLLENNWIRNNDAGPLVIKPVSVSDFGQKRIWDHADKWLCMSATIISPDQMAAELGLEDNYETVRVPMTFPIENRKVFVFNGPNLTSKTEQAERPKLIEYVQALVNHHPNERVLIHTVSNDRARYIKENIDVHREVITYQNATEREDALARYRATPGAVLLASSMDRGVDLADDDCRVVIVAKVPFPYIKDPQIDARMHTAGGKSWYGVQTVRSLVQMTGRGVRHKEDHAVSYIIDAQFLNNIWNSGRGLFPQWWKDAVDFSFPIRDLLTEEKSR